MARYTKADARDFVLRTAVRSLQDLAQRPNQLKRYLGEDADKGLEKVQDELLKLATQLDKRRRPAVEPEAKQSGSDDRPDHILEVGCRSEERYPAPAASVDEPEAG